MFHVSTKLTREPAQSALAVSRWLFLESWWHL